MGEIRAAGHGLYMVFWGTIVGIVGGVLSVIPLIGALVAVAGVVMELYGLYLMAQAADSYRTAFYCAIINLAVSAVSVFVNGTLISIVGDLVNLLLLYCVCTTTAGILEGLGGAEARAAAERGLLVWKINLACVIISVVSSVLIYVPVLGVLAGIAAVIMLVVSLVGGILYLIFLYKSQAILQAA